MSDIEAAVARAASEHRHRTANTLQLLSALARMRGQRSAEPESRRELLWMADAIGSIGALEKQRCADGIDFAAYLAEMAPVWRRRQGENPAEVVIEADALVATNQTASTLTLIAQELVGNALLHGFPGARPGRVRVGLRRLDDARCELLVEDDGVGFDPASPACRERFGLWLVRSLAAQVRGQFTLAQGSGVAARLTFDG